MTPAERSKKRVEEKFDKAAEAGLETANNRHHRAEAQRNYYKAKRLQKQLNKA